jgi:hypothetical protein
MYALAGYLQGIYEVVVLLISFVFISRLMNLRVLLAFMSLMRYVAMAKVCVFDDF